jgi:hypothetical protein
VLGIGNLYKKRGLATLREPGWVVVDLLNLFDLGFTVSQVVGVADAESISIIGAGQGARVGVVRRLAVVESKAGVIGVKFDHEVGESVRFFPVSGLGESVGVPEADGLDQRCLVIVDGDDRVLVELDLVERLFELLLADRSHWAIQGFLDNLVVVDAGTNSQNVDLPGLSLEDFVAKAEGQNRRYQTDDQGRFLHFLLLCLGWVVLLFE